MEPITEDHVLESLGSLHCKVDQLLADRASHAARIAALERWMWAVSGAVGLFCTFFVYKTRAILGL